MNLKALASIVLAVFASAATVAAQPASLDSVQSWLLANPPNGGDPLIREQAFLDLDEILGSDAADTSAAVEAFYGAMLERAVTQMLQPVESGAVIWQMYSHGFIVKNPETMFAFDLRHGFYPWTTKIPQEVLAQISVVFVSHQHPDHYSPELTQPIVTQGGAVLFPAELGQAASRSHLVSPGDELSFPGLEVRVHDGLHATEPLRIYEVVDSEGFKYMHTGDNQTSETLPLVEDIDVLLLNAWVNESGSTTSTVGVRNSIAKLKPGIAILGHIQELGHDFADGCRAPSHGAYHCALAVDDVPVESPIMVMAWGERLVIQGSGPVLGTPIPIYPGDLASDVATKIDLVWEPVDGATGYEIQLTNNSFNDPSIAMVTDGNVVTVVLPYASAPHFWRVRARSGDGRSAWSAVYRLTSASTGGLLPTDRSPADREEEVPLPVHLSWTPAPDADSHRVELSPRLTFTLAGVDTIVAANELTLEGLTENKTYFWRISGIDSLGRSTTTETMRFRTGSMSVRQQVDLIRPTDGEQGISSRPTLDWEKAANGLTYHLQVSPNLDFSTEQVVNDSTLTDDVYSVADPLGYLTRYFWRVRLSRPSPGPWSETWSFETAVGTSAELDAQLPTEFALHPAYPNPFNPSTTIRYDVPEAAEVRLTIFDALGRPVEDIGTRYLVPGTYTIAWDASRFPSGVYFVRMQAGTFSSHQTIILAK